MKIIRDTLYDYVPISTVEEELLKQPELLRLHKILQNSTLYQTYPNNRATRFSHSIGAMHVAGLLFKSLVLNSEKSQIEKLHSVTREFIKRVGTENSLDQVRDYLLSLHRKTNGKGEFHSQYGWNMRNDQYIKETDGKFPYYFNTINNILFQSIRLAALVHDIGHPPYSHVIEYPLSDLSMGSKRYFNTKIAQKVNEVSGRYLTVLTDKLIAPGGDKKLATELGFKPGQFHEMMGILIIDNIFRGRKLEQNITLTDAFYSICLRLSIQILTLDQLGHYLDERFIEWSNSTESIQQEIIGLYSLGSIVSGPIDCDRLDFLRRDPINSGVPEFGRVDATRIIAGIELLNPKPKGLLISSLAKKVSVPGFSRQSISALTEFFYERQKQNRWLRDHHNVVRTDLALSRLVLYWGNLLERDPDHEVSVILEKHKIPELWKFDLDNLSSSYRLLDDPWLETAINNINKDLEEILVNRPDEKPSSELKYSSVLLRVLLDRDYKNFKTIWKRRDGFQEFANGFQQAVLGELSLIRKVFGKNNKLVKNITRNQGKTKSIQFTNFFLLLMRDAIKKRYVLSSPFSIMIQVEDMVNKEFPSQPVHFALKSDSSYKPVSVTLNEPNSASPSKVLYLDEISSLIASLDQININDVRLYAYKLDLSGGERPDILDVKHLGQKTGEAVISLISTSTSRTSKAHD